MAILAYLRVSTDKQTTENQRKLLDRSGHKIKKFYEDCGVTSDKDMLPREGLQKLLSEVMAGDTVLVSNVSILSRSIEEVFEFVQKMKELGVSVKSRDIDYIDLTTAKGMTLLRIAKCRAFADEGIQ